MKSILVLRFDYSAQLIQMGNGASAFTNSYENSKAQGDAAFRSGLFSEAIYWYSHALSAFTINTDEDIFLHPSESDVLKQVAITFSNRSISFLENGQPTAALQDALKVIQFHPHWPKGYYRAGSASFQLKRFQEAKNFIATGIILAPSDPSIIKLHGEIDSIIDSISIDVVDSQRRSNLVDSSLYVWGKGLAGQLGLGLPLSDKVIPTAMSSLQGKLIQDIACGFLHSVAVTESGDLYVSNPEGIIDLPGEFELSYHPVSVLVLPRLIGMGKQ